MNAERLHVPPTIAAILRAVMEDPKAFAWWETPQAVLDDRSPRELWDEGDHDARKQFVRLLCAALSQ